MAASRPEESLIESIARWALDLHPVDIPESARKAAQRHLLDGIGCAVAGWRTGAAPFAEARAGVDGPATVLGSGRSAGTEGAAFANGVLTHALDFDDTHANALVHATAVVLPALLAVGEEVDASGEEATSAAVAGYETALRIGRAVRHGFHTRGFHATSACGVFSAAIIAARLRDFDLATTVNALGIAGSFASGLLEFLHSGSSTKQVHPGWASQAGIAAASLAAAGATGPATVLEGDYGIYAAYTGRRPEPHAVLEGLGDDWEVTRITIKPYPLCQLSHASLDAFSEVAGQVADPTTIEEITVRIPDESVPVVAEPRDSKLAPRTPYEAKFSLPWDLGVLALDGGISVDTFAPARIKRTDVRHLAQRVSVEPFATDMPAAAAPGQVEITLADGRRLQGEVPDSRGGPDWPLTDEDVIAKLTANVGDAVADPRHLADLALHPDGPPPIRELIAALTQKRSDV